MVRLIALSGPKGCGKTTAAYWLANDHGFYRLAFAEPIRAAVLDLFPKWNALAFEPGVKDRLCTHYGVSPRHALRVIGEHARALDPLIYIKHMEQRVEALPLGCSVVIDDLRMPSEAAWVRAHGGQVVHVRRSGLDWSGEHVTEQGPGYEPGDLALPNPAGLEHFRLMVRMVANGGAYGHA